MLFYVPGLNYGPMKLYCIIDNYIDLKGKNKGKVSFENIVFF